MINASENEVERQITYIHLKDPGLDMDINKLAVKCASVH